MGKVIQMATKPGKISIADLKKSMNKSMGMNAAHDLRQDNPTTVKEWIPTGSRWLDSIPDIGAQFDRKTTADVQALLNEALSTDTNSGTSETHKYGGEKDAVDAAFDKLVG